MWKRVFGQIWQYVLSAIVAIVVIACWDWIKALLPDLGNTVLSLMTFGLESVRDDLYREAARGLYDRSGPPLVAMAILAFLLFLAFVIIFSYGLLRLDRRINSEDVAPTADNSKLTPEKAHRRRSLMRQLRLMTHLLALIALPQALLLLYFGLRIAFTTTAAADAQQITQIVAPYAAEGQIMLWRSRIAQPTTRHEFLSVIDEMVQVGRAQGARFPKVEWF